MKIRHLIALALVLIASSACSKKDSPTGDDNTEQYESAISGVVVTNTGLPINGVLVTSQKSGTSVTSGEDGKFTLADLGAGDHSLQFFNENYEPATKSITLTLLEKKSLTDSIVLSYKYSTITGTVAKDGIPAKLAGITVKNQNVSVIADTLGRFTISDVVPGDLEIYSVLPDEGYGIERVSTVADSTYVISIDIDKFGGTIIGRVVDIADQPVTNARVEISNHLIDSTNSFGVFELNHLPSKTPLSITITKGELKQALAGLTVFEHGELNVGDIILHTTNSDTTKSPVVMLNEEYGFTLGEQDIVTLVAHYELKNPEYVINEYSWIYNDKGVTKTATTTVPNLELPTSLWSSTLAGVDTAWVKATAIKTEVDLESGVATIFSDTVESNLATVLINRTLPNNLAQFTSKPTDATLRIGENYSVILSAEDADEDDLIYTLEKGATEGVLFTDNTLSFTPVKADTFEVSVSVTDGKGVKDYATWKIFVEFIPPATITLTPEAITAPEAIITLSTVGMTETIRFLHLELEGATVGEVTLATADDNITVLTTEKSSTILVMPSGTGFAGAVDIATVSLTGLVAGTPVTVTQIVAKDENDRVIPLVDIPSVEVK